MCACMQSSLRACMHTLPACLRAPDARFGSAAGFGLGLGLGFGWGGSAACRVRPRWCARWVVIAAARSGDVRRWQAAPRRSAIAGWVGVGGWCSAAPAVQPICTAGAGSCAADSDAASPPRVRFRALAPWGGGCLSRYGMRFLTSRRCRGADSRLASFHYA